MWKQRNGNNVNNRWDDKWLAVCDGLMFLLAFILGVGVCALLVLRA